MRGFNLLFGFSLLLLISFSGEANINAATESVSDKVYIVYMGKTSSPDGAPRNDHAQLMSELMERKKDYVVQTYNMSFLGFAARFTEEEAESISRRPGVLSIYPDRVFQLHTTRSWEFLRYQNVVAGFSATSTSSHSEVSAWSTGGDTIIGIIDTGIWPEHESFNDKNMGGIPPRWKGKCDFGENSTYPLCNK